MTKEEIKATLIRCIDKVDFGHIVTFDSDELAYFFIDNQDCFYLDEIKTSFTIEDFLSIKYARETEFRDPYILIKFRNQSELTVRFDEADFKSANGQYYRGRDEIEVYFEQK